MPVLDCLEQLFKQAPKGVDEDELRNIFDQLKDAQVEAADKASNLFDRLNKARNKALEDFEADSRANQFRFWRSMEKTNDFLGLVEKFKNKKDGLFNAAKSYIDGTQYNIEGSRNSAELRRRRLELEIKGSYYQELKNEGVLPYWNSKENELEIARALLGESVRDPQAQKIGAILRKHLDNIEGQFNREGVYSRTLEERLTRNFHDPAKMKRADESYLSRIKDRFRLSNKEYKAKAYERWRNFTLPLLNIEKSFGEGVALRNDFSEIDTIMKRVYKTLTEGGDYLEPRDSIVKSFQRRRVLRWKDAESNIDYNKQYGLGTFNAAIDAEFHSAARKIASLNFFGDNRSSFIENMVEQARSRFPEMADQLTERQFNKLKTQLAHAFSDMNDPSSSIAKIGGNFRAAQNMAKLGNVLIRSLPDLAALNADTAPLFGSYLKAVFDSLKNVTKGLNKEEKKALGDFLSSAVDHDIGNSTRWIDADGMPGGVMTKMQRVFFKLNGLSYWDKSIRAYSVLTHSRFLAKNKNLSFEDMIKRDRRNGEFNVNTLKSYGLSGDDWNAIRKVPTKFVNKREYILPESAEGISDDVIADILKKEGSKNITKSRINEKRNQIRDNFQSYFVDRSDHAILRPSASVKQGLFQNTKDSSIEGVALRWIMQFKSYPATFISKPLRRQIYGRDADSFWDAIRNGKADYLGLSQVLAHSMLLGYISMSATNLTRGLTPPDPTKLSTIKESLVIGGFTSIYGDIIWGTNPNFGKGPLESNIGPQGADFGSALGIMIAAANGDFKSIPKKGAQLIRNNIWYQNHPLAKLPLDAWIWNRMQEAMSPGYTARKLRRLEEEGVKPYIPQ